MAQTISDGVSEAQRLEDLTGMGVPAEEIAPEATKAEEQQPEVKPEPKPEKKAKEKSEEDDSDEDIEDEDEDDDEGEDTDRTVRTVRPAKNKIGPIKAIFSQLKELRANQEQITTVLAGLKPSSSKQETADAVDEIKALAEKRELDPEALAEIINLAQKKMMDDLEKSGKLNKEIPKEIQDKLKAFEKMQADAKEKEEIAQFENEFLELLPELEKQYPNAKAAEKAEAKKLLDELSHTKQFSTCTLDYVLYKNRSKFDAILKVAKGTKSGEGTSKQIVDHEDEEDIDLDPENMTPEKMKAYQKRKHSQPSDKPQMIG